MTWKKIAWFSEVASASSNTPDAVDGTAAASGSNSDASRDDHEHALGPLVATLDINKKMMDGLVLENTLTAPDGSSEAEAQIFYNNNTGNQHAFIWVP